MDLSNVDSKRDLQSGLESTIEDFDFTVKERTWQPGFEHVQTHSPVPLKFKNSSRARRSTSSGNAAGPAPKLCERIISSFAATADASASVPRTPVMELSASMPFDNRIGNHRLRRAHSNYLVTSLLNTGGHDGDSI